jgi:hypothetical protein
MKDFQTFPNTKEIINVSSYSFFSRLSISPQEISEKVKKSLSRERVVVSQSSPQHPKNRDASSGRLFAIPSVIYLENSGLQSMGQGKDASLVSRLSYWS